MIARRPALDDDFAAVQSARWLGTVVAVVAATVLTGWVLDIPVLRSILPFGVAMRANAALALLLGGLALVALAGPDPGRYRTFAAVAGLLIALLGAVTLWQDISGTPLGIDEWLVDDNNRSARTANPGRMSPPTSFCLILVGCALALQARRVDWRFTHVVTGSLGVVVIVIGAIAIIARATESVFDLGFLRYTRIATYSAAAFICLGAGLLLLARRWERTPWSLDRPTTIAFVTGGIAMIVMAGVSYELTNQMRVEVDRVNRVQNILRDVYGLSAALSDFTLSAGRYIITRDERTLQSRAASKAAVAARLERLRSYLAGEAVQAQRIEELARLHARRVLLSDEIIERVRESMAAGMPLGSGSGSPLGREYPALGSEMDRLLAAVAASEHAALAGEEAKAARASTVAFLLLPLSLFVAMTILSLAFFYLNAVAVDRTRADAQLATNRERLGVLLDIDRAIAAGKSPVEIAKAVLPRLRELLGVARISVYAVDATRSRADWVVTVGRKRALVEEGIHYPLELMGDIDALARGEPQLVDVADIRDRGEKTALFNAGVHWYTVIPLTVGTDLIGGLSFGEASRSFSAAQREIALPIAAQIATAIRQARLGDIARQADARYRLIFESVPVGVAMTTLDGTLLSINPSLARALGFASVALAEQGLRQSIRRAYLDPSQFDVYVRRLLGERVVSNFETRLRRCDGTPIWVSLSGRLVQDVRGATQLSSTVDDITWRKDQERRIARLNRVKEMQSSLNAAVVRIRDRQLLLDELCRIAVEIGGLRAAWVAWHDKDERRLQAIASAGSLDGFLDLVAIATELPANGTLGPTLRAFRSGVSCVIHDTRVATEVVHREAALARDFLSAMHLPLTLGGVVEGVLVLFADVPHFFDDEERRLLDALAADVSFGLDALRMSARLDYLAYYDPLSGLPNRALFQDRLSQTLHSGGGDRPVAIALIDIERFHRINESHGRSAGDRLLRDIATRLGRCNETAAHLGLDVFGVTLPPARNVGDINRSLDAVLAACFSEPFDVGGESLRIASRAAVSVYPSDAADAESLVRNAEAALKIGKAHNERVVYYAPEMNARVAEALATENKLRLAVERQEFILHYQPKVELGTERIVGLEALIRWRDPDSGSIVAPLAFIPVLEETGMIAEVGRWAVEQAFRDLRAWAVEGYRVPRVAVNVSAVQLQAKDFVASMVNAIRTGGDTPELLDLEITESLMMRNVDQSTTKLSILRGMGVTVAIDDFGTGYSSLSYLSRLPVDSLKIDRSFVSGLPHSAEAAAIVSTVVALAHSLKLEVVAEGVETRGQADALLRLGCDQAQGYLFSPPRPASEIGPLLDRARTSPLV